MKKFNITYEQMVNAYNSIGSIHGAASFLGIGENTFTKYAKEMNCYKDFKGYGHNSGNNCGSTNYIESGRFNYHILDRIDTREKAYIIGFLAADGCPDDRGISIQISTRDEEFLIFLCNYLQSEYDRIKRFDIPNSNPLKENYHVSWVDFRSKHLVKSLARYNIIRNRMSKELDMFSCIPDKYKDSWLVGYIDGNGTIYKNDKNICIETNRTTARSIVNYYKSIDEHIGTHIYDKGTGSVTVSLRNSREMLIRYLYSCTFHLSRKKENAERLLHLTQGWYYHLCIEEIFPSKCCKVCGKPLVKMSNKKYVEEMLCTTCGNYLHNIKKDSESSNNNRVFSKLCQSKKPSKENLLEDLKCGNFIKIGEKYGVSDNAVRKWCKSYNLDTHSSYWRCFKITENY